MTEFVAPNDTPDQYEAPNGIEAALPGQADRPATRDPSSTTVAGAKTNEMARLADLATFIIPPGSGALPPIDMPPTPYT